MAAIFLLRGKGFERAFLDEHSVVPAPGNKRQQTRMHFQNEQRVQFSLSFVVSQSFWPIAVADEDFFKVLASEPIRGETLYAKVHAAVALPLRAYSESTSKYGIDEMRIRVMIEQHVARFKGPSKVSDDPAEVSAVLDQLGFWAEKCT